MGSAEAIDHHSKNWDGSNEESGGGTRESDLRLRHEVPGHAELTERIERNPAQT